MKFQNYLFSGGWNKLPLIEVSACISRKHSENMLAVSSYLALVLISPIDGLDFKNVKTPAMHLTAYEWQRKSIE